MYAAKGHGAIVSGPNGSKRQELASGDFALIPAFAEHQEVNDSDEEVTWIITPGAETQSCTTSKVGERVNGACRVGHREQRAFVFLYINIPLRGGTRSYSK